MAAINRTIELRPKPSPAGVSASFRPGALWPDNNGIHINAHGGGVLFHAGVYYWFGEHKVGGSIGNSAQIGVHVYSSTDLYHWKDERIALKVSEDPSSEITRGCVLERPKVIYNTGTKEFVMWFHLELKGQGYCAARSGVAVASHVTGPYRFVESFRINPRIWPMNVPEQLKRPLCDEEKLASAHARLARRSEPEYVNNQIFRRDIESGQMARDMTLFVDEDGSAYHIYASEENAVLHISQLTADYRRPSGKYVRVFPGRSHEAPALFRHKGKYYMITSGCTGWDPNAARSAVADSIWGPWLELGNPCVGSDVEVTFHSQSTCVIPVADKPGAFIFAADRWRPDNASDGRYIWLPIEFDAGRPMLRWKDKWDMRVF